MLGTDAVVGGSGQDVSRTVPGAGKPHPDKTALSGLALPAQSFLHEHRSCILCCKWQRELCCGGDDKNLLMGMLKSCHLFTLAVIMGIFMQGCSSVIMEIFIGGCSCVFPYTLIKAFQKLLWAQ